MQERPTLEALTLEPLKMKAVTCTAPRLPCGLWVKMKAGMKTSSPSAFQAVSPPCPSCLLKARSGRRRRSSGSHPRKNLKVGRSSTFPTCDRTSHKTRTTSLKVAEKPLPCAVLKVFHQTQGANPARKDCVKVLYQSPFLCPCLCLCPFLCPFLFLCLCLFLFL